QALLRIYPGARRGTLVRPQPQESDCGVENVSASTCGGGPILPASACTHAIGTLRDPDTPVDILATHPLTAPVQDSARSVADRQSSMEYGNVIDARRRRHIWLCADDYGMSPAVNVAIRDLVVRGRINATSVMVVAPNFNRSEAVSLNILNASETRVAIGLHV